MHSNVSNVEAFCYPHRWLGHTHGVQEHSGHVGSSGLQVRKSRLPNVPGQLQLIRRAGTVTHEPQPRPVAMTRRVGKEGALSASAGSALSMVQKTVSIIDLLEKIPVSVAWKWALWKVMGTR